MFLQELTKQIEKIEQEVKEEDYFGFSKEDYLHGGYPQTQQAYDEGYIAVMRTVRDYLLGISSLPNNPQFEIVDK